MSYWAASRQARHSLLFALPLLIAYEGLAWALGQSGGAAVRNGADVLLKRLFMALGGSFGLRAFAVVLLGTGLVLVVRDVRRHGPPAPRVFAGMALEAAGYGLVLGVVAGALTSLLLTGRVVLALGGQMADFAFPVQVMVSLGAGLYEELVFRVLLVAGLAALAARLFGWKPVLAGGFAALTGALLFSAFHYIGPYGDPWQVTSFTFRAIAGLLFSVMYLTRGFGIAAWSHALYDVYLAIGGG